MAQDFTATINQWVAKSERRITAVFKEASQRVLAEANAGVPVDTGFARASFLTTINAPADQVTFRPIEGGSFPYNSGQLALTIAGAELGDTIFGVWTANYVIYLEYGSRGRSGRGFARLAAQRWGSIVAEVSREAQARFP